MQVIGGELKGKVHLTLNFPPFAVLEVVLKKIWQEPSRIGLTISPTLSREN